MRPDSLYDGIVKLRRQRRRQLLGVVSIIVGLALVVVAAI
jgi:hypothetical protein